MPPQRLFSARVNSFGPQPFLLTQQGGEPTSQVWLNGEFCAKPWMQTLPESIQSPPDLIEDEVSEPELALSDSEPEGT